MLFGLVPNKGQVGKCSMVAGTFYASNSGDGGPVPVTGKVTASHYVYLLKMNDEDLVQVVTKVWNTGWALGELGWT